MPKKTAPKTPRLRIMRCGVTGKPIETTDHAMWLVHGDPRSQTALVLPIALSTYHELFDLPERMGAPDIDKVVSEAGYLLYYAIVEPDDQGHFFLFEPGQVELGALVGQITSNSMAHTPDLNRAFSEDAG